jgi:RNA polymerase sigma-70 factor (ECF subfamily)
VEDAALFAQIADGDEGAIEALSNRFGGAMRSVALRVTRNEHLAEEIVQDALMAVWRDPSRYDPNRGTLGPWLLTLTRYKAIDAVRREVAIARHTADVDLEFREAPDDVHGEVWLSIRRERLYEAIATLGADQRRALEFAFIGGLTHVEVAEREGIPLGTAKTRIRSALLKLRDVLGPSLGSDPESVAAGSAPGASPAGPGRARRPVSAPRPITGSETGARSAGRAPPIRRHPGTEPEPEPSLVPEAPIHATQDRAPRQGAGAPDVGDTAGTAGQHRVEERPHA